jgi:hypothetical protein
MDPSASINPARYGPILDLNSNSVLTFDSMLKYLFIVFTLILPNPPQQAR